MSNPKEIWLSPACHAKPHGDGRLWCEDDVWGECEELDNKSHYCGEKSVRYVIASEFERLERECERLRGECEGCPMSIAEDMRAQRDAALKQVEGLRRDAERYRLYREGLEDPDAFDANVDAALQAKKGGDS